MVFDGEPFGREPVAQVRQRVDFAFDAAVQFVIPEQSSQSVLRKPRMKGYLPCNWRWFTSQGCSRCLLSTTSTGDSPPKLSISFNQYSAS